MNKLEIKRANHYLIEADEPEEEVADEAIPPKEETEPTNKVHSTSENIEIYFNNLDEETQETILAALKEELNAAEDDKLADNKIRVEIVKKPLFVTTADDIRKQLNINI